MRQYLLILIQLICGTVCYANNILERSIQLKTLYSKLTLVYNDELRSKYELQFFQSFPADFNTFNAIYGFTNDTLALLYNDAENHLELLLKTNAVNDTTKAEKLLSICENGKWNADAVSYLQSGVTSLLIENMKLYCYLLDKKNKSSVKSIWYFLLDGPHPDKKFRYNNALLKLKDVDKYQYELMIEQYDLLLKTDDGHGH